MELTEAKKIAKRFVKLHKGCFQNFKEVREQDVERALFVGKSGVVFTAEDIVEMDLVFLLMEMELTSGINT